MAEHKHHYKAERKELQMSFIYMQCVACSDIKILMISSLLEDQGYGTLKVFRHREELQERTFT